MKKTSRNVMDVIPIDRIERRIYFIRGRKVMLDHDLAELYQVETRVLNQSVRRNIERFPPDFLFSLTREEIMNLSQIVISSKMKHAPNVYAFTEQGITMLSSVLRSKRAVRVNIEIMRAFIKLRELMFSHKNLALKNYKLQKQFKDHDKRITIIFQAIRQLLEEPEPKKKGPMGFQPPVLTQ